MSNPLDYNIGDHVNVTIQDVRIARPRSATSVTITDEHGVTYQMPPQAEVERIVSADWPPRPGDLWRELRPGGGLWFIFRDPSVLHRSASGLRAREADGDRWADDALDLLHDCAPLELVYREPEAVPPGMRCPHRDFDDPTRCDCDQAVRS